MRVESQRLENQYAETMYHIYSVPHHIDSVPYTETAYTRYPKNPTEKVEKNQVVSASFVGFGVLKCLFVGQFLGLCFAAKRRFFGEPRGCLCHLGGWGHSPLSASLLPFFWGCD